MAREALGGAAAYLRPGVRILDRLALARPGLPDDGMGQDGHSAQTGTARS